MAISLIGTTLILEALPAVPNASNRSRQTLRIYAIGVDTARAELDILPTDTSQTLHDKLSALVRQHFDLRPKGIIQMLDLQRPIYEKTAAYGHFGRDEPEFTWEATDKAELLRSEAGLKRNAA